MGTLHTINKSPFEKRSLESCLRVTLPGSTILLIEDGVYAAMKGGEFEATLVAAIDRVNVCCLQPDWLARGLGDRTAIEGIDFVDYEGFVALAVAHERVQAWL